MSRAMTCRAFMQRYASWRSFRGPSATHGCARRKRPRLTERERPAARSGRYLPGCEVQGQLCQHGTGYDAECCAAVLTTHAVEGERAEVVEREEFAGQESHHHALNARQRIRQPQDVARQTRHA